MTTSTEDETDIVGEIWEIKDALSAAYGHDLRVLCRALYAEQDAHPDRYVDLQVAYPLAATDRTPQRSTPEN